MLTWQTRASKFGNFYASGLYAHFWPADMRSLSVDVRDTNRLFIAVANGMLQDCCPSDPVGFLIGFLRGLIIMLLRLLVRY